jgi:hypothetical protein
MRVSVTPSTVTAPPAISALAAPPEGASAQQLEEDVQFDELALQREAVNGQEILRSGGL